MRSPTAALLWQIGARNRQAAAMLVAITLVAWVADVAVYGMHPVRSAGAPGPLNELAAMAAFLLLLAVFGFTEPSGDRGIGRFPPRLFTLPVSTLRLVGVPMLAGAVAMELLYLAWMGRFTTDGSTSRVYVAILLATYMVFYQTVLWTSARLGPLRLVLLGAIALVLFIAGLAPSSAPPGAPGWRSEGFLGGAAVIAAAGSFLFAWHHVARLRSGGERSPVKLDAFIGRLLDAIPGRRDAFASAPAAQFWYEWRNGGTALPLLVGAILACVLLPVSWASRHDAGSGAVFLFGALLMPIVLAVPLGMAFAKPVFWTEDLAMPPFVAVRPLSAEQVVATKLRVAALATAIAWALVLAFVAVWLSTWGDAEWLGNFATQLWAVNNHSAAAVYAIAALVVIVGMVLTWRFLSAGIWAGHSGNRRLYVWSVTAVILAVASYFIFSADRLPGWVLANPERMAPFVWLCAALVIAKMWLAARTWRRASGPFLRKYLGAWVAGTAAFVALAMVFWRIVRIYVALDAVRLQALLVLAALLVVPLARVGMAPGLLERNRHRR